MPNPVNGRCRSRPVLAEKRQGVCEDSSLSMSAMNQRILKFQNRWKQQLRDNEAASEGNSKSRKRLISARDRVAVSKRGGRKRIERKKRRETGIKYRTFRRRVALAFNSGAIVPGIYITALRQNFSIQACRALLILLFVSPISL